MNDVPDRERCEKLCDEGFPQDKSILIHVYMDYVDAFVVDTRKSYKAKDLDHRRGLWFAAPIMTELVEEIKKLNPPKREDDAWIDVDIMADGTVYAGIPALLDEHDYKMADTVPNVLTDLWLWLRGREKS